MKKKTVYWLLCALGIPVLVLAIIFHNSELLFTLGTVELAAIALVVTAFVAVYSRRNWTANPYGRALMYSKISLAILADLSLATAFLGPDWEWRGALRLMLFAGILVAQTRLFQLLFKVRKYEAQQKREFRQNGSEEVVT